MDCYRSMAVLISGLPCPLVSQTVLLCICRVLTTTPEFIQLVVRHNSGLPLLDNLLSLPRSDATVLHHSYRVVTNRLLVPDSVLRNVEQYLLVTPVQSCRVQRIVDSVARLLVVEDQYPSVL